MAHGPCGRSKVPVWNEAVGGNAVVNCKLYSLYLTFPGSRFTGGGGRGSLGIREPGSNQRSSGFGRIPRSPSVGGRVCPLVASLGTTCRLSGQVGSPDLGSSRGLATGRGSRLRPFPRVIPAPHLPERCRLIRTEKFHEQMNVFSFFFQMNVFEDAF